MVVLGEPHLIDTQMRQIARALNELCVPAMRAKLPEDVCALCLLVGQAFQEGTCRSYFAKNREHVLLLVSHVAESVFGEWPKKMEDEEWDYLTVYHMVDNVSVTILGEMRVCDQKVTALANGARTECALALERNFMDDYAFDLLIELKLALDKDGDGGIDTDEVIEAMVSNGTLEDPEHPLRELTTAHLAMHALLDATTGESADESLDAFATSLLGAETVGALKVKAITAAMKMCAEVLSRRGFGPDCPMLFQAACQALDSDGDGQIDAEEFKALECAKGQVDQILRYDSAHKRHDPEKDTVEVAIEALDVMAIALIGEQAVGELKITAIANAMIFIKDLLKQPEYPPDCIDLFVSSCDALDADGDGQIDAEEFRAIKSAKGYMDIILDVESEALERILALDKMAMCLLGPEDVATIKLKVIFDNLVACAAVLEKLEMDHYSVSLLQDTVAMLDGDGDGDIEADEFQLALAKQGRIVEGEALLQPVADAKLAVDRLLHCEDTAQGYIELDAMAVQLLGQDLVGELKMKAIKAAAEECARIISAFHLGSDAVELFTEAFNGLDRDGDGKIDAEEFAAIADAKRSMDDLLHATSKEEVEVALDGVALGLLGPEAVALLKVKAIYGFVETCRERLTDYKLDADHFNLLEMVEEYSKTAKEAKFVDAAGALDQDGDGDVSEEEFLAAQAACNSCRLLMASSTFEDVAFHLEAMTLGLFGEEKYSERRCQHMDEKLAAVNEWIVQYSECGQYEKDLLSEFKYDNLSCGDMLELPCRATALKRLEQDVQQATDGFACTTLIDQLMQFWLDPLAYAQVKIADIVAKLPGCETKLEDNEMDQYSFRLLSDMNYAVDKDGDGDIDPEEIRATLEAAKGGPIVGSAELLKAVASAKVAMTNFLYATTKEDIEDTLDLFAEELLGKLVVAQLKVAAILDALNRCTGVLEGLNFGDDALELFKESCLALDADGDGQIDPEEFKAVTSAKGDVDAILIAESEREASDALDRLAESLLGYDRLAIYKLNAVARVIGKCCECINRHSLDNECVKLIELIATRIEDGTALREEAVQAKEMAFELLDANPGDVATSLLDRLAVAIIGEDGVREHKSQAISIAVKAVLEHSRTVETVGDLIVPATVGALLEEVRVCAPDGTTVAQMTQIKLVSVAASTPDCWRCR